MAEDGEWQRMVEGENGRESEPENGRINGRGKEEERMAENKWKRETKGWQRQKEDERGWQSRERMAVREMLRDGRYSRGRQTEIILLA